MTLLLCSWCRYIGATYGISGLHWYAAGATIQVQHMVFLDPIGMQLVPLYRCNIWYFLPHWYAAGVTIKVKHKVFLDPIVMQLVPLYRCNIWYFWTLLVHSWCHYSGATYGIKLIIHPPFFINFVLYFLLLKLTLFLVCFFLRLKS